MVAVCAVLTAVAVAVKDAFVDPLATVTDAGTLRELLLLARSTLTPPLAAADVSETVHASVPAPVTAPLLHVTSLRLAALSLVALSPVPLNATVAVPALLTMVSLPDAAPAAVVSNPMSIVIVSPGVSVIGREGRTEGGRVSPAMENLLPVSDPLVMISGAVPEEVTVTDFDVDVLSATVPKPRLVVLSVISAVDAAYPVAAKDANSTANSPGRSPEPGRMTENFAKDER
jgi:hypothetical protein